MVSNSFSYSDNQVQYGYQQTIENFHWLISPTDHIHNHEAKWQRKHGQYNNRSSERPSFTDNNLWYPYMTNIPLPVQHKCIWSKHTYLSSIPVCDLMILTCQSYLYMVKTYLPIKYTCIWSKHTYLSNIPVYDLNILTC